MAPYGSRHASVGWNAEGHEKVGYRGYQIRKAQAYDETMQYLFPTLLGCNDNDTSRSHHGEKAGGTANYHHWDVSSILQKDILLRG